jgi:malate/lactate dehydrogenase
MVLQSVIRAMEPIRKDAILLVVSNPVDVLTFFAQRLSGLPWGRVVGSGTLLDSVRLKGGLARRAGVAETSINAWVIGEHGDSQCVSFISLFSLLLWRMELRGGNIANEEGIGRLVFSNLLWRSTYGIIEPR